MPAPTSCTSHRSHLLPRLAQRHIDVDLLLVAVDGDLDCVSGAMVVHHLRQVLLILDLLIIDGHDQVAAEHDGSIAEISPLSSGAKARLIRRPTWNYLYDQQSEIYRQTDLIREFLADRNGAYPKRRTPHTAERHQVVENRLGGIDGNRKPDTGALIGVGENHGVDTDHLSMPVHQRAARVAGIDRGVGLDGFVNHCAI